MSAVEKAREALADWDYDQEQGCMSVRDVPTAYDFADLVRDLLGVIDERDAYIRKQAGAWHDLHAILDDERAALARVGALADEWDADGQIRSSSPSRMAADLLHAAELRAALKSPTKVQDSSALTLDGDGNE